MIGSNESLDSLSSVVSEDKETILKLFSTKEKKAEKILKILLKFSGMDQSNYKVL